MTDDLERLEALARAAHKWVSMYDSRSSFREPDDPPMPPNQPRAALEEFRMACKPDAILSLIQRVREADRLLKIESGIRYAAQQNFLNAFANGRAAGRAEALEEAARWHEAEIARLEDQIEHNNEYARRSGNFDGKANDFCRSLISNHRSGSAAIRALGEKAG